MSRSVELQWQADSIEEFERLHARAQVICGSQLRIAIPGASYKSEVLRRIHGNPATRILTFEFDAKALDLLAIRSDALAVLSIIERLLNENI